MSAQGTNDLFDPEGVTLRGLSAGQRLFGRFTLQRLLGRGGMGVVWLARDEKLERDVALKFLPEMLALDERALDDLKHETRRSLDLTHPHIVRIHDFFEDGRTAAIAMEFVDGPSLSRLALEQPARVFEPEQLLPWVRQLGAALDCAHVEVRVVHRDLKPANLLTTSRGQLKVADFGISAMMSETVTRVSRVVASSSGTPLYMSPQQMRGLAPTPADDIYSLGATLYELLTGRPPFFRGDVQLQVKEEKPPALAARRAELKVDGGRIPPVWEETIAACLAKDPAARPRTAGEVAMRLSGGAAGPSAAAPPAQAKIQNRKSKIPLWPGLAAALVLGAGVAWFAVRSEPEEKSVQQEPGPQEQNAAAGPQVLSSPETDAGNGGVNQTVSTATPVAGLDLASAPPDVSVAIPAPVLVPPREFVLTVDPHDAAARVWLGPKSDVAVEAGRLTLADLPDGEHELIVQAPGYQPFSTRVTVREGRGEASARLVEVKGAVQIRVRPGTSVTALAPDGRNVSLGTAGTDGLLRSDNVLTVGAYTFRLEHPDSAPVETPRQELLVGRALSLTPAQVPLPGELRIFTVPTGAEVRLDGAASGTTPATLKDVTAEKPLNLEVVLRGYRRVQQEITLKPKEVRTLNLGTLVAEAGALDFRFSNFDFGSGGARVTVDGRVTVPTREGSAWRIDGLEVGTRTLAVTHADYEPWTQQVAVRDQQNTSVTVTLQPKPAALTLAVQGPSEYTLRAGGKDLPVSRGRVSLPAGQPVELELVARGYKSARRTVTLPANGADTWSVALEKLRGAETGQPWAVPDLSLEMVWIAPGTFAMGSPASESGRADDEGPQTQVTLTTGYWLGKYEVTQSQWQTLMGSNPSNFKNVGANAPVEQVSWNDAMEFCLKLTERERAAGRLPEGYAYTLPTEAQWEYACRAGTTGAYAGSGNLGDMGWYNQNSGGTTHPVGQKRSNAWGLYDMHGNVLEWCADRSANKLPGGSVRDPIGASSGSYRVFRGGGWNFDAQFCRSAYRYWSGPGFRNLDLGFRFALSSVR